MKGEAIKKPQEILVERIIDNICARRNEENPEESPMFS